MNCDDICIVAKKVVKVDQDLDPDHVVGIENVDQDRGIEDQDQRIDEREETTKVEMVDLEDINKFEIKNIYNQGKRYAHEKKNLNFEEKTTTTTKLTYSSLSLFFLLKIVI